MLFRRPKIYAIIETGGKQYKVSPGQVIDVERLNVTEGSSVDLDRVLLIADGDKVTVGSPVVEGARVVATAKGEGKSPKTIIFKYKAKKRYYKKAGHRQAYTTLAIDKIVGPGAASEEPVKKARRSRKKVETDGT